MSMSLYLLPALLLAVEAFEKRLIVLEKDSTPGSRPAQKASAGVATTARLHMGRKLGTGDMLYVAEAQTEADMEGLIAEIKASPDVLSVEEDRKMYPTYVPDDPEFSRLPSFLPTSTGIGATEAWDVTRGEGVIVAVLDTGSLPHEDLVANTMEDGWDFINNVFTSNDGDGRDDDPTDPGDWVSSASDCNNDFARLRSSWHGTHVAGTIAAVDNDVGVVGVAPGARLLPVRVLGRCGGWSSDIADAMIWAAGGEISGVPVRPEGRRAHVINLSLSGKNGGNPCTGHYGRAMQRVTALGAVVVASAGNDNDDAGKLNPASCPDAVTVAAVGATGARAVYSNSGSVVDVAAPGGDFTTDGTGILSTLNSGTRGAQNDIYREYQGTSMAAPHVSGVAALLFSLGTKTPVTAARVREVLRTTAKPFPRPCASCGAGIVDAAAAVRAVAACSSDGDCRDGFWCSRPLAAGCDTPQVCIAVPTVGEGSACGATDTCHRPAICAGSLQCTDGVCTCPPGTVCTTPAPPTPAPTPVPSPSGCPPSHPLPACGRCFVDAAQAQSSGCLGCPTSHPYAACGLCWVDVAQAVSGNCFA